MKKIVLAALAGSMLAGMNVQAQEASASSWADKLTLKGDLRARFESIDEEGKETRDRARLRARLGAYATVSDEVDAAIALASGDSDPVSTNQTLDEGFSSKDVKLDLAYIDLHPEVLPGSIVLGKMIKPFINVNDLIWDGDLNPEGASAKFVFGEGIKIHAQAGAFWVEERSSDDETMLYSAQAAAELKTDAAKITAGASYYLYDSMAGFAPIYDETDSFGNTVIESVDADGNVTYTYAYDYELFELFAKIGFDAGLPVELTGNYVVNQDADENDTGYMFGIKLGKLKDPGSFDIGYSFRELEADAVVGAFSDSDFIGGGTDGSGHKLSLGYQIAKNLTGNATYFMSEKGIDSGVDYDRLQLDLVVKF